MKMYSNYDHFTVNAIFFECGEIASSECIGLGAIITITKDMFKWDKDNADWSNWIMVF